MKIAEYPPEIIWFTSAPFSNKYSTKILFSNLTA
jgi:hypothetical protein